MDFNKILQQWETGIHQSTRKKPKHNLSASGKANWLEEYPPDQSRIDEKDSLKPPPISTSRTKLIKMKPQETLDLHGMTEQEARNALIDFIQSLAMRGLQKGLVIHGKGLHSPDGSVLAPMVREILEGSNKVGRFDHPRGRDGGKGATWFLLRNH